MRGKWGMLVFGAAAALLTGCTNMVPGSPAPEPAARAPVTIDDYGLDLTLRERGDLQTAAVLRTIDPCGFFSHAQLSKYGQVAQVAPYLTPESCQVRIHSGDTRAESIEVQLSARKPDSAADHPVDGGSVLRAKEPVADEECELIVPMKLPAAGVGDPGGSTFTEYAQVTAESFSGDNCAPAGAVASRILGAVRDLKVPLRRYAVTVLPGGDFDPCALLGRMPAGWTVARLTSVANPYDCTFYARKDQVDQYIAVRLEVGKADAPASTRQASIDLGGRPATSYCPGTSSPEVPETCFIDFALDGVYDGNIANSPLRTSEQAYGKVRTTVSVYGAKTVVQELALAAAAIYR
ncbi:hypothetical protein [Nocardia sp. NPDC051832]|uniref:hypothetical protein n=1 Tax=Nocardia sp. NPDC051832 TaxID=3155673 RepID=UPI00343B9D05